MEFELGRMNRDSHPKLSRCGFRSIDGSVGGLSFRGGERYSFHMAVIRKSILYCQKSPLSLLLIRSDQQVAL